MGAHLIHIDEAVLANTHNLCLGQKKKMEIFINYQLKNDIDSWNQER